MTVAACTMAYDERLFLPIWAGYYARQFGAENLFVIDHGSDDGGTDLLPRVVNRIRLPRGELDEYDRPNIVSGLLQMLRSSYDAIVFGDTDELVIADPAHYSGLAEFCANAPEVVVPVGLNVFQDQATESSLDFHRPICGQPRFCQFKPDFCEPILTRRRRGNPRPLLRPLLRFGVG